MLAGRMLMTLTGLLSQSDKHHHNHATDVFADADPTPVVRGYDQRAVKKGLIEIGEVQTVLCKVGEALRFIP